MTVSYSSSEELRRIRGGWNEVIAFVIVNGTLLLLGVGNLLNILFPLSATLLGFRLYTKYPVRYFAFVWWMWFLTPLVRRIADFQSFYREPSPILLAPSLVTLISALTLLKKVPQKEVEGFSLYLLGFVSVCYGLCVGMLNYSIIAVGIKGLQWLLPILFGYHVYYSWSKYPLLKASLYRVFKWGTAVMGIYGVYQYVVAPPWDRLWLISSGLLGFQGSPEPLGIRVWSTMDSGEPFGAIMSGGLILLLSKGDSSSLLASVPGYLSFLLATVRSAWLGWVAGFFILATSLKPKQQIRLIILSAVLMLILISISSSSVFSEVIASRFSTFGDLESDQSFSARQGTYANLLGEALSSLVGLGIGGTIYDSAVLTSLFNLGWIGTALYLGSLSTLLIRLFGSSYVHRDPFIKVSQAVVITALIRIPLNVPMLEASGLLLWGILSLGLAAEKYARAEREETPQLSHLSITSD